MDPVIATGISSLLGTVVGASITYLTNRQAQAQELKLLREEHKTDYMAEDAVRHFLSHKGYVERSFDVIKKHLGGFGDDELRKILVRAGAFRTFRKDDSEWWKLFSRMDEWRANLNDKDEAQGFEPDSSAKWHN